MADYDEDVSIDPATRIAMGVVRGKRPQLSKLYEELSTKLNTPDDFTGVQPIMQARSAGAERDFASGLAMQMLGGKTMRPSGQALARHGLENQAPLRLNEADVGYVHPETGAVTPNPANYSRRAEKGLMAQITAAERGEAADAALAERARSTDADRALREMIANNQLALRRDLAKMAADRKASSEAGGKPLTMPEARTLMDAQSAVGAATDIKNSFKPEYTATVTPLGEAQNWIASNVGGTQTMKDQAAWWADYNRRMNFIERHEMFGATLTQNEKQSWEGANIQPGMDPKEIEKRLATRERLARTAAERWEETLKAGGRNPRQIEATRPRGATGSYDAPSGKPRIKSTEEYNALPSGTTYIDPNGVERTKR